MGILGGVEKQCNPRKARTGGDSISIQPRTPILRHKMFTMILTILLFDDQAQTIGITQPPSSIPLSPLSLNATSRFVSLTSVNLLTQILVAHK